MKLRYRVFTNKDIVSKILYFCQDPFEARRINKTFYMVHKRYLNKPMPINICKLYFYKYGRLIYTPSGFFYFQQHRWHNISEALLEKHFLIIKRQLENLKLDLKLDEVISPKFLEILKKDLYTDVAMDIDGSKWLFSNGIFDIETSTFRDGIPNDYLSVGIPIPYKKFHNLQREKLFTSEQILSTLFDTTNDLKLFLEFAKAAAVNQKLKITLVGEGNKLITRILKNTFNRYIAVNHRGPTKPHIKLFVYSFDVFISGIPRKSQYPDKSICILYNNAVIGHQTINTAKKLPNLSYKNEIEDMSLYLRAIIIRDR
ncbi:MAG TPA: hypothetical protein PKD85_00245 [Saprospiraceae bacterium]|nr:hypothetical protein [Saprospiraceae bacterium]